MAGRGVPLVAYVNSYVAPTPLPVNRTVTYAPAAVEQMASALINIAVGFGNTSMLRGEPFTVPGQPTGP